MADATFEESETSPERRQRTGGAGVTPAGSPLSLEEKLQRARARYEELRKQEELRELDDRIAAMTASAASAQRRANSLSSEEQSPHGRSAEVQPEKLREYWGNSIREHREWFQSAENAFRLAPRKFRKDSTRIAWSVQSLRGTPATSWFNVVDKMDESKQSWRGLKEFLLNLIEDPENRELDAAQAYADARQRPGQSVQQFNQYLISLESQLDSNYSEAQRRVHLWTKLAPDIRQQITNYQQIPKTRDGIVQLATRIENNRKRQASPHPEVRRSRQRRDSAERDRSQAPWRQSGSDSQSSRDTSGLKKPEASCFFCGIRGHLKADCRKFRSLYGTPEVGKANRIPSLPQRESSSKN